MTRLPAPFGHRIDRKKPLAFTFEGRAYSGFEGDTIASALAANGQWMLSRSFKYHRPRGVLSMAGSEANTLVQLPDDPNVAADLAALESGMEVTAQNVNGSLAHDCDAIIDRFGRFLPVGFYYRTFMGPTQSAWLKLWEPLIRKKAGLGRIDTATSMHPVDKQTLHCDVIVIGAGPAGLSAAAQAAANGVDVILVDDQPDLGGSMTFAPEPDADLVALCNAVTNDTNIRVMRRTFCSGLFEDNWLALIRDNTLTRVRAAHVILACGAIEQPAVFRNNDLPGILLGSAAQRLIHHYGVKPGSTAVVLAANPQGYAVAHDLIAAGVTVAAIVDPRAGGSGTPPQGVPVMTGTIRAAKGKNHVQAVQVGEQWINCDLVTVSIGHIPAWQLPCQAGAKLGYDEAVPRFTLALDSATIHLAGSIAGHAGHATVCADGRGAAARATDTAQPALPDDSLIAGAHFEMPLVPHPKGKDFVDLDEDLQIKDLQNAVKEGYRELELVKRFSTVGMGPSQGRHSAFATARIVATATDRRVADVGVTTARPPTGPETLGVLAGHAHTSERRTALHQQHVALGAEMKPVGAWWRPYVYGQGDRTARIHKEVAAVREAVGVLDVSTLGKLEVRGPDAGAFLDRIYTMAHANQPVGRVRYCLMLNEMGAIMDDGVAYRMADDCFYVTATTGAVARVYADMTFWNAQWRMNVDVVNLTAAFSGLNITGPKARAVVDALDGDIDFSAEGFPYLNGRQGVVAGIPTRAMRIGFTGELSFELHCPSSHAPDLWKAVMQAGKAQGLVPYGLEASRILRLEKGHILIGQDTDALTSPDELGFGWAVSKKKPFFVGKRALEMRRNLGQTRALVGLSFGPEAANLPDESCLVLKDGKPVGHVTSVAWSPTVGRTIALAYVAQQDAAAGSTVTIRARNGAMIQAPVVPHGFFDPTNERQDI